MKLATASRQIVSIVKRFIVIPPVFSAFKVLREFSAKENSPDVLVHGFFKRFRQERLEAERTTKCAGLPWDPWRAATPGRKVTEVCAPPATWSIPQKMQFFSTTLVVAGLRRKISALLAWRQTFEASYHR